MDFGQEYKSYKERFESYLSEVTGELVPAGDSIKPRELLAAMRYAVRDGKRLRPILFLAVCDHYYNSNATSDSASNSGGRDGQTENSGKIQWRECERDDVKLLAVAIEVLHCYTLVHDDLPCLDGDDFRRGAPSCHKKFGEATALLAGDALLNFAYELILRAANINPTVLSAAAEFAFLAGAWGLIGGQASELELENRLLSGEQGSQDELLSIYMGKTAALFAGSAVLGGGAFSCRETEKNLLREFGKNFGLAFQLRDDICDMDKKSFAHLFGKEETERQIQDFSARAEAAAEKLKIPFLRQFVNIHKVFAK